MTRGVVYMVWGDKAVWAAGQSIASLWKIEPTIPVLAVGDESVDVLKEELKGDKRLETKLEMTIDPFRGVEFLAGRIKPYLYHLSPWQQTLYVDADTTFRGSPQVGFDLLERWDFLVAETGGRTILQHMVGENEAKYTRGLFGGAQFILYHNSGMLFWKRNGRVEELLRLWGEEWQRFGAWDEQMALLRAIGRSKALVLTIPYTWNTNAPSQAKVLFHEFGQRTAWKFKKRRGRVLTGDELMLLASQIRNRGRRPARMKPKTGADVMLEQTGKKRRRTTPKVMTGADLALRRKPRKAARNKAISDEEARNK